MGLTNFFVGGGVTSAVDAVGNAFDKIFTSDEERANAEAVLTKIAQKPHLLQAEINKIEASHRSVFVAGWRPFIGWVCGCALAWHFILYDLLAWAQVVFWPSTPPLPQLTGTSELITVLMALLGLGGLRTVEKLQGRAK